MEIQLVLERVSKKSMNHLDPHPRCGPSTGDASRCGPATQVASQIRAVGKHIIPPKPSDRIFPRLHRDTARDLVPHRESSSLDGSSRSAFEYETHAVTQSGDSIFNTTEYYVVAYVPADCARIKILLNFLRGGPSPHGAPSVPLFCASFSCKTARSKEPGAASFEPSSAP